MLYVACGEITRRAVASAECKQPMAKSMGTPHFRPPTESTSLNRSLKNVARVITSTTTTPIPNFVQIRLCGTCRKWVKCNTNYFYLFYTHFGNSPTGQTGRWIFTFDGSTDADSRKDVLLGFRLYCTLFRGSNSRKIPFWGRE